ncbi:MAG: response regulator [Clostridiales bacterium]|nr:response regulator [Clostridiales bacterium]
MDIKTKLKKLVKDKRFIYGVIAFITVVVVTITIVLYSLFASNLINEESAEHLTEIYSQANAGFYQKVRSNRNLLKSWKPYIDDIVTDMNSDDEQTKTAAEQEFGDFMLEQLLRFDFTKFYFIGEQTESTHYEDYEYKVKVKAIETSNKVNGEVQFDENGNTIEHIQDNDVVDVRTRRDVNFLLANDRCGVASFVDNGQIHAPEPEFLMLAIPTTENTYKGFTYRAIGVRFELRDVSTLLSAQTFGTSGICYVILPNGQVLAHSGDDRYLKSDYLAFLKSDQCEVLDTTVDKISSDWNKQKSGSFRLKTRDTEYYLTYMPVDPRVETDPENAWDWMLLGIAPSEVVNSSMNYFRNITMVVMAVIFVVIGAVVAALIILNSRRKVAHTVAAVKGRDKLLDLLSVNTDDMFIMFSTETFRADYVSANVEQVLGIPQSKIISNVMEIIPASLEDSSPLTIDDFKNMPTDNTWERDVSLQNMETMEKRWFRLALHHSNSSDKCVLVLSDRTEDIKMREQLEEALQIAENANAAKSHFLSNMSHDIRTPMNAIIGYATLLGKDADNADRVRDYVRKITYSGQHLLSLINDILDMSKIESGKTSLALNEFRLPEFIEELYSMMVAQANAKKQTFDVHTKGTLPEFVVGDKLRLNQIMLNILSNAVKYTQVGGTIKMNVERLKQKISNHAHIRFIVEDNGIGMSPEYLKTIFEPFSRETTDKTKGIQGTGLGMAITKNIVDLMGGTISVESELGKGSKFIVELELAIANSVQDDGDFWKRHNVTRVLVIDDEEDVCVEIKELMADTGVEIDYRLNGKDGVKAVEDAVEKGEEYNIVIVDWKMPDMDGVETARRIRKRVGRELPIMVLTSFSFEDIEDSAKDAGIDLFLSKPFFVSNFRRAIQQINTDGTEAEVEPEKEDISIEGLKVLAAEDNEINVEILMELLEDEGVKCDIAYNGQEALEKFEASAVDQYDVIFMDVQMPVMDGYGASRAIRACSHKRAKTIPIIAMTANAFDDDVKAALESGMNAHLAKPIDMAKLKQLVAKHVLNKKD